MNAMMWSGLSEATTIKSQLSPTAWSDRAAKVSYESTFIISRDKKWWQLALHVNKLYQLPGDNPSNKNESNLSDLKYDWWKMIDEWCTTAHIDS